MVYRWNLDGTALEFPTPYQVENRFLTLRGYALLAVALLIMVVLSFVGESESAQPVVALDKLPEKASVWPYALVAFWMTVLGVLNLVQAARQRALLMVPGQPASLMQEVPHEATGASPHASWLMQSMSRGMASAQALKGAYAPWLLRLSPEVSAAPGTLQTYLRVRVSHLLLLSGLALLLAGGAGAAMVLERPTALPMVALVVGLLAALLFARHALQFGAPALSPWLVAMVLLLALAAAAPLAWYSAALPWAEKWPRLGLPSGVALLLGLAFVLEGLALWAARQQIEPLRPARVSAEEISVNFEADLAQLFNEVDRELFRRWSEGIPNRRYVRQPPAVDLAVEEGSFAATVLEESQPLVPPAAAGHPAPPGARWLLTLAALGLALSVLGGATWLWLAFAHMRDSTASWLPALPGLVCLLGGGYALRLGHLLWSRTEVGSTLTWLELKGTYFRVPAPAAPAGAPGRRSAESTAGVDGLALKACVVQARSVFYAAGRHTMGSRALVALTGDAKAAAAWTALVQTMARNASASPAAASPAMLAARAKAHERRAADADGPAMPKRPARFCSACGTPLLAGARFCQQCGSTVSAD